MSRLNYGCKRIDPKLNLDQLDNNLSDDLRNDLDHLSLISEANKAYEVKVTNVKTGETTSIKPSNYHREL